MTKEIDLFANAIRKNLIESMNSKGGGHIGGCLSVSDLVAVLYSGVMKVDSANPQWEERDYLVCSKGHCAPAIYAALAIRGFFPKEWLSSLNKAGTNLPGHGDRLKVPGVDATTGSLGQGLSIACGIAHAIKNSDRNQYVYCIIGDGESNEGQIWEAAMYAANYNLDNLILFLDWNKKQIDGTNDQVMKLFDIEAKFREFGWYSQTINGNDTSKILEAIGNAKQQRVEGKPAFILMDTIKGAGVLMIEVIENNHCIGVPNELADECLEYLDIVQNQLLEIIE